MTMSGRSGELVASAFLTALAGATVIGAWRLGLGSVHSPGPGFMPFATAALLGLMALGRLARLSAGGADAADTRPFAQSRWSVVLIVLGTLGGFGLAIERVGFTVSTVLLLLVLFGIVARKRRHWANGGPTTLSNLAMLCRRHHRAVHEEGYQVERQIDGELRFRRPDGRLLPDIPAPPAIADDPVQALRARNEAAGLHIDGRTSRAGWVGERLDVGRAIDVLHPRALRPSGAFPSCRES